MKTTNNGKKGGYLKGDRHSAPSGGIRAVVTDLNKPVLLESDEVIITRNAVLDTKERVLKGTNKEILSQINEGGGGVPILKDGGIIGDELNWDNGRAIVKRGRKVIAKIYDRKIFFAKVLNRKYSYSEKYPYSIEITGVGMRECESLEECLSFIDKYAFEQGGSITSIFGSSEWINILGA